MKKLYTFILLSIAATAAVAQTQLPNSGFENWIIVEGQLDPEGYYTSDSLDFNTYLREAVTRSDDAHTDSYSVKIGVVDNNSGGVLVGMIKAGNSMDSGVPLAGKPNKVRGWAKTILWDQTALLQFTFNVDQGGFPTQIGDAVVSLAGNNPWTQFEENVVMADTMTPTSVNFSVNMPQSGMDSFFVYLDDLELVYGGTGIDEPNYIHANLYPNPTEHIAYLTNDRTPQGSLLIVTDVTGRVISSGEVTSREVRIETPEAGIFIVTIQHPDGTQLYRQKLVVQ